MQPYGSSGWLKYINEILLKDTWQSLQVIYFDFLLRQCTKCAHILEDVQSASCDAATCFSGSFRSTSIQLCQRISDEVFDWFIMIFYLPENRVCPHPEGCTKCILWCSNKDIRVNLDLYQWVCNIRQLMKFASYLEWFLTFIVDIVCPYLRGFTDCILWCSHKVLRVDLESYQ
jgi:hypothetical protein